MQGDRHSLKSVRDELAALPAEDRGDALKALLNNPKIKPSASTVRKWKRLVEGRAS